MSRTPFPASPRDVAALTVQEFTFELDNSETPSIDVACRKFVDDANRALVWLIRFRALKTWCDRADMAARLNARAGTSRDVCEVAASFRLNDNWEFEAEAFCRAIESLISRRRRTRYW